MLWTKEDIRNFFILPNSGLRLYTARTVAGKADIIRTPYWDQTEDWQSIVDEWLDQLRSSKVMSEYPGLLSYEEEMRGKVGPMSVQKPLTERIADVEAYFVHPESTPLDPRALQAVVDEWKGLKGLSVRSPEATLANMTLNTNSGNPWFTKRKRITDTILDTKVYTEDGQRWWLDTPQGKYELAALLGWRGQNGGPTPDDVKQRVIWMMSAALNLQELRFYQPLISGIQKLNLIPAYVSMRNVDECVTRLFDGKERDQLVICTDFSKYDQHFCRDMEDAALNIFDSLAANDATWSWWKEQIYPAKFRIPIVCSEKLVGRGSRESMGSGSGGTNADESTSHRALQWEAAITANALLNEDSQCLGDDGMVSYPGITLQHVIDTYTSHGQEMNPDKQFVSTTECVYLRRWHSTDYRDEHGVMVGVYATCRALGKLLFQERFYDPEIWGPKAITLRAWSILENCASHPLFYDFVDFVLKGDRYHLGLDIPGFLDGNQAQEELSRIRTKDADFLGYVKETQGDTDLKHWRIYQYLSSMQHK